MGKTVLLAGATGMMGEKIARALLARGAAVRLMARGGLAHPKAAALAPLVAQGASVMDADLADHDGLVAAARRADVVVSALQGGPEVIVDGQVALARAAKAAGVARMIPSDFSFDFRTLPEADHLFIGWRQRADAAIAALGLAQTNVMNGAFMEMLTTPFFGMVDPAAGVVRHWGDPDQPLAFSATDDAAAWAAEAALDPAAPDGALLVAGEIASAAQVAAAAAQAWGRPFRLETLGDRAALDAEIARRQAAAPADPMAWVALQYHRGMLATPVSDADNARYPAVRPTGLAAFLAREAASAALARSVAIGARPPRNAPRP
jgi:uncharacterized protein YbjT (DUF2867 family)